MTARQAVRVLLARSDGLVLAVNRPQQPGALCLPGGKVEPGEDLRQAAVRETLEETGVRLPASSLRPLFTGEVGNDREHDHAIYAVTTFACEWNAAWPMPRQVEEGLLPRWVDLETLARTCARPGYDHRVIAAWRLDRAAGHRPRRAAR